MKQQPDSISYSLGKSLPLLFIIGLSFFFIYAIAYENEEITLLLLIIPLIALLLFFPKEKIWINFHNKTIRRGIGVSTFSWQRTKSLPSSMNYLSGVSMNFRSKPLGSDLLGRVDLRIKYKELVVSIVHNKREKITLFSGKEDEIMDTVKVIAKGLSLNIYKVTASGKKWIYLKDIKDKEILNSSDN